MQSHILECLRYAFFKRAVRMLYEGTLKGSHSAYNLKHEGVHFFSDLFVADVSAILLSLYEQVQECQPSLRAWNNTVAHFTSSILNAFCGLPPV